MLPAQEATVSAARRSAHPAPPVAQAVVPKDVWLDCSWNEIWKITTSIGSQTHEDTSNHSFQRSYLFSPKSEKLFRYDDKEEDLFAESAEIAPEYLVIHDKQHYQTMFSDSSTERVWSVGRQDLKVKLVGSDRSDTRLDDGRIMSTFMVQSGDGACVMTDPKPLAPILPNKF
jgi:hypothetical protein